MSLKIIKCEKPTISCFYNHLIRDGLGNVTSLEESKRERIKSIVLGKVVNINAAFSDTGRFIFIVKEVLSNLQYGETFKAVICGDLAVQLAIFHPGVGDRLAFFEPFILNNTVYRKTVNNTIALKPPKYLLEIGGRNRSIMWCAKKELVTTEVETKSKTVTKAGNSSNDQDVQVQDNGCNSAAQTQGINDVEINGDNQQQRTNQNTELEKHNNSHLKTSGERQKPHIQLPHNPQIPSDTQRLNPRYKYKKLADIKSNALMGDLDRVNIFAVVHQIAKPLTTTYHGKFTVICKVIDESTEDLINFNLHFFTSEDTIIKQIEMGDVLRLHRVKLELWNSDVDGRVFNNVDIMLFKHNAKDAVPIVVAKNTTFPDDEKERVQTLRKWYKDFMQWELAKVVLLSEIYQEGEYQVLVKVVSEPEAKNKMVILRVTDGSPVSRLTPSDPLHDGHTSTDHIVTEISVFDRQNEFAKLKAGDFVMLREVKATKTNALRLMINTPVIYQIVDQKLDKVLNIKRKIKQFDIPEDDTVISVLPSPNDSTSNNCQPAQDLNYALVKKKDDSPRTRSETLKNKSIDEVRSKFSPCGNNSCVKSRITANKRKTEKRNIESKESDSNTENAGAKTRKPLFTANYTDLSDATDDASDILDTLTQFGGEANKGTGTVIVTPANTSFGDLIELVKTKYCSPRKISCLEHPKTSERTTRQQIMRENDFNINKLAVEQDSAKRTVQTPVVKLVKLTDEECKSLDGRQKPSEEIGKNTRSKKRTSKETELLQENMEDAETVVNEPFQSSLKKGNQGTKRIRFESESTVQGSSGFMAEPLPSVDDFSLNIPQQKVSNWLLNPNNRLADQQMEEIETNEVQLSTARHLLLGQEPEPPDMSHCLTSHIKRLSVFLMEVIPEPTSEPLDLVSGYCYSGCHQLFLYSKIHWQYTEDISIPLCPDCIKLQREKKLELMFMMQLHVMDLKGKHDTLVVCREHAQNFMNCTTTDFVKDTAIRMSRIQLLLDYTVLNTQHALHTPLLDVSVIQHGQLLCLVNSTLKLPVSL